MSQPTPDTVRTFFPELYAESIDKNPGLWGLTLDWRQPDAVISSVPAIICLQQSRAAPADGLVRVTAAAFRDLQRIKQQFPAPEVVVLCNYIQFSMAVTPMGLGVTSRHLGLSHDWIVYSLIDEMPYSSTHEMSAERIAQFRVLSHHDVLDSVIEWFSLFYYYVRKSGGLCELATLLCPMAASLFKSELQSRLNDQSFIKFACFFANWAYSSGEALAGHLIVDLEVAYGAPGISPRSRTLLGLLFSTKVGRMTGRLPKDWASATLAERDRELTAHEKLQLLVSATTTIEEALERTEVIKEAITDYRNWLEAGGINEYVWLSYDRARLLDLLMPLLLVLFDAGYVAKAIEILSEWYGVPAGNRRTGPVICCLPTHRSGTVYVSEEAAFKYPHENQASFADLTRAANEFLNVNVTLNDYAGLVPHEPTCPGVPVPEKAAALASHLREHYALDRFRTDLQKVPVGAGGLVVLPGLQHPIQPLMLAELGTCWPIAASLQQPEPDRRIRRVLLWAGGTFTDEIEIEAVSGCFRRHGVTCRIVRSDEASKQRFLAEYVNPEWDAVWVTSHGSCDHYEPHMACIQVAERQLVSLGELKRLPAPGGGRRLLFLNICDGGTATPLGGLNEFGIASALSGSTQAGVSHLWPVDFRVAPIFGTLLCVGLVLKGSLFEAFEWAAERLRMEHRMLADELEQYLGPDVEILGLMRSSPIDTGNLQHWASPVFYE